MTEQPPEQPTPLAQQILLKASQVQDPNELREMCEHFLAAIVNYSELEQDRYIKTGASFFHYRFDTARKRVMELRVDQDLRQYIEEFESWADGWLTRFPPEDPDTESVMAQVYFVAAKLALSETVMVREAGRAKAVKILQSLKLARADSVFNEALSQALANRAKPDMDPEPWPDPVDGGVLLESIRETYLRYAVLSDDVVNTLALFVLLTHCHEAFDILPILLMKSPIKRCGKTRVLEISGAVVRRPIMASNISAAAIYRSIELWSPTLLLDEADSFLTGRAHTPAQEDLRNVVNSGHTRSMAWVLRVGGEGKDEPRKFSTWAPKILACIGDLPDTIEDRAIVIVMRRRLRVEAVTRWRHVYAGKLIPMQRQAARWGQDNVTRLRDMDPEAPDTLNDREQDCWRPLLAIADLVGGPWPERARAAARALSGREDEGKGPVPEGQQLLQHIREVFEAQEPIPDRMSSQAIVRALIARPESPWQNYHRGRPISDVEVSNMLRPFGIQSSTMRVLEPADLTSAPDAPPVERVRRGYFLQSLRDALARYTSTSDKAS